MEGVIDDDEDEEQIFNLEMVEQASDMASKLDALMDLMFNFLASHRQRYNNSFNFSILITLTNFKRCAEVPVSKRNYSTSCFDFLMRLY